MCLSPKIPLISWRSKVFNNQIAGTSITPLLLHLSRTTFLSIKIIARVFSKKKYLISHQCLTRHICQFSRILMNLSTQKINKRRLNKSKNISNTISRKKNFQNNARYSLRTVKPLNIVLFRFKHVNVSKVGRGTIASTVAGDWA